MADAELDAVRVPFVIYYQKPCVALLVRRLEPVELPIVAVMLERNRPGFGKIVRYPFRWREVEVADTVERGINDWVDDKIDAPNSVTDDRAYLTGKTRFLPMARVVAELEVDTIKERSVFRMRRHKERPQLEAIDHEPSLVRHGVKRQI